MSISDFVPTLQPMAENVSVTLRYVCFFVLTSSIIFKAAKARHGSPSSLLRPIVNAALLSGLIATLPFWFNTIRDEFWAIAVSIRAEFASDVAPTGTALMQLIKPPEDGINWLDVTDSLTKSVQFALGWLVVCVGGMIQLPMMLVQFIMECLCYMFLPVAISLFAIDATRGLATRYIQQTLAILAWPIGFAVVDLVGYSILLGPISAGSALAIGVGAASKFTPATLILGCIVAIWLVLGSLATPLVMQALFCSGTPLSSSVTDVIQMIAASAGIARVSAIASVATASATTPLAQGMSHPPVAPATASTRPTPIYTATNPTQAPEARPLIQPINY